jgi:hypothetical protein
MQRSHFSFQFSVVIPYWCWDIFSPVLHYIILFKNTQLQAEVFRLLQDITYVSLYNIAQ